MSRLSKYLSDQITDSVIDSQELMICKTDMSDCAPLNLGTDSYDAPLGMREEQDPLGIDAHMPGAKLDAGKPRPELVFRGFARALAAVTDVATFGANKYSDDGWMSVPNGQKRYADAGYRHALKRYAGEEIDPDSKCYHLAAEAWNKLAELELYLREKK